MEKATPVLLGVFYLFLTPCYVGADQLGADDVNGPPMAVRSEAGERRTPTPEVVLQLKYDRGELNKIYLTQFRKELTPNVPSVPASTELCADLCHEGLGGLACGSSCTDMLPVGLATALRNGNQTDQQYGKPRVEVCPALCQNNLGDPLCNCSPTTESSLTGLTDWAGICSAFCQADGYVLGGCPPCQEEASSTPIPVQVASLRILDTSEGWVSWCNVQCRQGQGGAACNCDRTPFQ